jgi:hypothetical protein
LVSHTKGRTQTAGISKCQGDSEEGSGRMRLHNEDPDIMVIKSRSIRWVGHVACTGERINAYKIFIRTPERKRPCGRPRHRWEEIRMDLREIRWEGMEKHLALDRDQWWALENTIMNLRVP